MREPPIQSLEYWPDERDTATRLDASGRIVDYLNPKITRRDTAEERVRQSFARQLHTDRCSECGTVNEQDQGPGVGQRSRNVRVTL